MNREAAATRQWYFWPLVALILGLLLGLLVGWVIWPVSYKNALPQDLRPAERDIYLSMVAESFARNSDLALARERLSTWPAEELSVALNNLQDRLMDTDARLANDVQLLASSLNLPVAPAGRPTPAPTRAAPAAPTGAGSLLKTVCTVVLWVLLALLGIVALVWLFNRWRVAQRKRPGPAIGESVRDLARETGADSRSAAEIAEEAKAEWPRTGRAPYAEREPEAPAVRWTEVRDEDLYAAERPQPPQPAEPSRPAEPLRPASVPPAEPLPVAPVRRAPVAPSAAAPVKLGDYVAIYQMGEPDYDEAFDINDPVEGTMGQCGLQLIDPVGRNRDQAVALQAWLWDGSDPDTRVKVLMSEGAYRDTALRSAQAGTYEAIPVRAGTEFELESHDLLLRGRVDKVEYADIEVPRSVFMELHVRFQAYRKA